VCRRGGGGVSSGPGIVCVNIKLLSMFPFAPQISGDFKIDGNGNVELKEEDGIDYAAVTVQMPGGERVPFLFTIKELEAKGTADAFGGEFTVPSYRGSSFLDPKVGCSALATCAGGGGAVACLDLLLRGGWRKEQLW